MIAHFNSSHQSFPLCVKCVLFYGKKLLNTCNLSYKVVFIIPKNFPIRKYLLHVLSFYKVFVNLCGLKLDISFFLIHIGIWHGTLRGIQVCTKSIILCFFCIVMIVCQRKISETQTSILPFNSLVCDSITFH